MVPNNTDLQKAFDALFAEFIAAQARNDARVKNVQNCFCIACEGLIKTLKEQPKPLDSFGT